MLRAPECGALARISARAGVGGRAMGVRGGAQGAQECAKCTPELTGKRRAGGELWLDGDEMLPRGTSRAPGKAAPVEVNVALLERAEAALHAVLVLLDRIEGLRCGDLEFLAGALGDLANEVESTRRFAVRRRKFEERKIVPQREIVSAVHIFGVDTRVARVWCSMEHRLDIMVTQMSLQFSTAS